jgi:hypothetical protein
LLGFVVKNMKKEEWKRIKNFPKYEISNFGFVRNIKRNKFITPFITGGYLRVTLYNNDIKQRKLFIHRLVAIEFIENKENKPQVNHKDGNKKNNLLKNLEWCTSKENICHAHINGLSKHYKGDGNKLHKLSQAQVEEIRKSSRMGKLLAVEFNVS